MNKKLQVFISSTYTDLIEERQAAVQAVLDAGHIPAGMELFRAGKSQLKTIYKWIDESNVYVLILGGRYGSIEEESGLSYTELEYRYALSKGMPVFAIVLEDSFLFLKAASKGGDAIFEKEHYNKYETFKNFIKTKVVKFVNNIEQIATIIHSHLNSIAKDEDYNLPAWIRENNMLSNTQPGLYNRKIGKYTYYELVNALENKKFDIIITDNISALDFFILLYSMFHEGFSIDYSEDRGILGYLSLIGESFIYNSLCPYYAAFGLLKCEDQEYVFTEDGLYFYSLLTTEYNI